MALFLDEAQVTELLDMPSCIAAVEEAFRDKAEGLAANQPRRRIPVDGRRFIVMAGTMSRSGWCAIKAYGAGRSMDVFLYRLGEGLVAVMHASRLGKVRTGAASGVATKFMARPDAGRLGCFGTGDQAETQILAVAAVRKLESIHVYGRDPQKRRAFAGKMSGLLGQEVRPVDSPDDAVEGRDIIITMTNASTPVFDGKLIEPGTHINAAGANLRINRELDEIAITRAGFITADDVEGAKAECGDLDWPVQRGLISWEKVYELAPVVAGRIAGRRSPEEITLFESQGIALEDAAAGRLVYERAIQRGIGTLLPF